MKVNFILILLKVFFLSACFLFNITISGIFCQMKMDWDICILFFECLQTTPIYVTLLYCIAFIVASTHLKDYF